MSATVWQTAPRSHRQRSGAAQVLSTQQAPSAAPPQEGTHMPFWHSKLVLLQDDPFDDAWQLPLALQKWQAEHWESLQQVGGGVQADESKLPPRHTCIAESAWPQRSGQALVLPSQQGSGGLPQVGPHLLLDPHIRLALHPVEQQA